MAPRSSLGGRGGDAGEGVVDEDGGDGGGGGEGVAVEDSGAGRGAVEGRPNVFFAGDDAQAKTAVAAFIESLGLSPLDAGGLKMAHWLEGMGVVTMGLAGNGIGHWDFALGVDEFTG